MGFHRKRVEGEYFLTHLPKSIYYYLFALTRPYPNNWLADDCLKGRSHKWHYKYSKPYTVVWFVACRVCSKVLGIGMAERAWGALNIIKDGRRAHLSGESTEMCLIAYISARLEQQRIVREEAERIDTEGKIICLGMMT